MNGPAHSALITGGAGFIGSRLAGRLLESGYAVTCFDNLHPQVHVRRERPSSLPGEAELVVGDITEPASIEAALEQARPDVVVHLAAETGTGQSLLEATRHGSVNVVGTSQLVDACARSGIVPKHFVLASSRAVYGEGRWQTEGGCSFSPAGRAQADLAAGRWDPTGPDGTVARSLPSRAGTTPPEPTNVYAATKLAQEHILSAWCEGLGSSLSVLRLQNVYGPGQSLRNSYTGVVALFCRLAVEGKAIPVYEDGAIIRDFVFVDDVVAALAAAVASPPSRRRLLDIGSGVPTTIRGVATVLARMTNAPAPQVTGLFRAGDVRAASCDIAPAMDSLGWEPQWTLDQGLRALIEWVRATGTEAAT